MYMIMFADQCKGLYIPNRPVSSSGSSSAWGMIESLFMVCWKSSSDKSSSCSTVSLLLFLSVPDAV